MFAWLVSRCTSIPQNIKIIAHFYSAQTDWWFYSCKLYLKGEGCSCITWCCCTSSSDYSYWDKMLAVVAAWSFLWSSGEMFSWVILAAGYYIVSFTTALRGNPYFLRKITCLWNCIQDNKINFRKIQIVTPVTNVNTALLKGHVIWCVCVTIFTQGPAIQMDNLTSGCEVTSEGKKIYEFRGGWTQFVYLM